MNALRGKSECFNKATFDDMGKPFCRQLQSGFPSSSEAADLFSTYMANCLFNTYLSYTAVKLNIVTIHAIRKTSSLPKPLKVLLMSLAVSDICTGLIVQPFFISILVKRIQGIIPDCSVYKLFTMIMAFFSFASFLGVVAVSVDRFLAIQLHLRYQELVTYKRVVAVVTSIWLFSALLAFVPFRLEPSIPAVLFATIGVICLIFTAAMYGRIYVVLQRHKVQTQAQAVQFQIVEQAAQNGDMTSFARLRKSAVSIFCIYVVFLVCYLPRFIYLAASKINGPSLALKGFSVYSCTLIFLNSSLNPVIYCWKMRHIRHVIMDILRGVIVHQHRNC